MTSQDWWSLLSTLPPASFSLLQQVVLVLSAILSGLLAIYAIHVWMLTLFSLKGTRLSPVSLPETWPSVSVHLPVYNERAVISRLLDAVLAFDYPHSKLEILVLDDSDDETTALLESYQRKFPQLVRVIHRERRDGFKAGALQIALTQSDSEYVALFDADQVPPPDFLKRMVPYLWADSSAAFAQGRPCYLHSGNSLVARALSLGMDSFAFVDQEARFAGDLLIHFSGGGGVFRRSALVEVGGWASETLAEDLDLSVRLRLRGWRYVYDHSVACPGEAPTDFSVLQRQQFRWASGFTGCFKKHAKDILSADQMSMLQKAEAMAYLTGYVASPLIAAGVVLAVLYCLVFPVDFIMNGFLHNAFAAFTLPISALIYTAPVALFTVAVLRSTEGWARRVARIVDFVCLGLLSVAIFLTSTRAVMAGLLDRATYFYRTPKRGDSSRE